MKKIIVKISAIMMSAFLIVGASSFSVFADENTNVTTEVAEDEIVDDFVNDTNIDDEITDLSTTITDDSDTEDEITDPSMAITEDEITDPSATTDDGTIEDSVGKTEQEPNITYMSTANGVFSVSSDTRAVIESLDDGSSYVPGELLVIYDNNVSSVDSVGMFSSETEGIASVEMIEEIDVVKVTLDDDASMRDKIIEISTEPGVSYVQPNYILYFDDFYEENYEPVSNIETINTNDAYISKQIYLDQINIQGAWAKVLASDYHTVRVAILDGGALLSHEDIQGSILTQYCRDVTKEKVGGDYPLCTESDNHGTAISSVIGATANNGLGIAGTATCGLANNSPLEYFCVDVKENGVTNTDLLAKGIDYAVASGAQIINISLGYSEPEAAYVNRVLKMAIDNAYNNNVICVCSAGNGLGDVDYYPSDDDHVISVTNLHTIDYDDSTDQLIARDFEDYRRAASSNYNSCKDIAAPGRSIYCAFGENDAHYSYASGTSLSAPIVASVIALMLMVNPNLTFEDVYTIITSSATDIVYSGNVDENGNPIQENAGVGFDIYTGYGLINADACVSYLIDAGTSTIMDWEFDSVSHTLTIKGFCDIPNYTLDSNYKSTAPWGQYANQIHYLDIGNGVRSIGDYAFYGCNNLESMTIGDNVKRIGDRAFYDCSVGGNLVLPKDLKEIGTCAFYWCEMLRGDLVIPDSVTSIGDAAFSNCCFNGTLTIGSGLTKINRSCFHGNNFSGILSIPDNITEIGFCAFEDCKHITGLSLSGNLTKIDSYAFETCTALTGTIIIPDSVKSIGFNAFRECSNISGLVIGAGAQEIDWQAFAYCKNLQSIVVNAANTVYDSRNNCNAIIETAKKSLVVGCKGTVIPEGIETIDDYSFKGNLIDAKEITLPQSIEYIDSHAFYDCTGLTGILILPNNVRSIGYDTFYNCGITGLILGNKIESIGSLAFDECKKLTGNLVIPDSVTRLAEGAFADTRFTSVVIGKGVSTIESGTFGGCKSLESVSFTYNVKEINNYAFQDCSKLKDVHYSGTETQKQSITIGNKNDHLINATWHCAGGGGANFDDVLPNDWFAPSVNFVYSRGIMKGMGGTKDFAPYDPLQREQLAIMLYRLEGTPKTTYVGRFNDVPNGTWYTDAIMWAYSKGVITGYQNGNFGVGDCITREQFATMLYRYANYKGLNTSGKANISGYLDAGLVSGWAYDAISWAVGNGIITGKDNKTRLDPLGNAARCECAAMIQRFMEKYGL